MNSPSWHTRTLVLSAALGFAAGALIVGAFVHADYCHVAVSPTLVERGRQNTPLPPDATARSPLPVTKSNPASTGAMDEYRRLAALPRSPETMRQLAALLSDLAHRDSAAAMSAALGEANWAWRVELRDAVLRGWAEADAAAAAAWARRLPPVDRAEAMCAVLTGAATNPKTAIDLASAASASEPAHAAEYGDALLTALATRGAFAAAAEFVAAQPATPLQLEEADTAFSRWAANRPAEAAAAVDHLAGPELRRAAQHGIAVGWSQADPVAAAEYAATLPPGDARAELVANALPRWVEHDPISAATWLEEHGNGPDFDVGVVAVATLPRLVGQNPTLALTLAQSISDAALRTNTLRNP